MNTNRPRLVVYPMPAIHMRVESITPRGGSMGFTTEYIVTAAFNLADGTITLDEFLAAVKMGPEEKRAPKTFKPKPEKPKRARKPPEPRKPVDASKNPWD